MHTGGTLATGLTVGVSETVGVGTSVIVGVTVGPTISIIAGVVLERTFSLAWSELPVSGPANDSYFSFSC